MVIDKLWEIDERVHSLVKKHTDDYKKMKNTPKTASIVLHYISCTSFIKNGIIEMYKSENLYSAKILFRALLEHYVRFQYIVTQALLVKNDSVTNDFLYFYKAKEEIALMKAYKRVAGLVDISLYGDPLEELKKIKPEYSDITNRIIEERSSQFEFKKIIEYFNSKLNEENNPNSFILNILKSYPDLSSFVHGGPTALHIIIEMQQNDTLEEDIKEITKMAVMTVAVVIQFTFLFFYQEHKMFGNSYNEVVELISKIHNV